MRLCFGGTSSASTLLETEIRAAAEAGFNCLDLWAPKLDAYLATYPLLLLDACLQEHDVYALAISGLEPVPLHSRADIALTQAHFLELCTRLDALGGGIVVVCPGPWAGQATDEETLAAWTARALQGLSDLAAPFEVSVAFEFRGDAHSSVRSLAHSQDIVRLAKRHNVGLALRTLDFHLSGSELDEIDDLDIDRLWLVHLGDTKDVPQDTPGHESRVLPGHGVIPLREICERLSAQGFQGPYSVEMPFCRRPLAETARAARHAALNVLSPTNPNTRE